MGRYPPGAAAMAVMRSGGRGRVTVRVMIFHFEPPYTSTGYIDIYPHRAYCNRRRMTFLGTGKMKRENKTSLLNRLRRVEGQVRGIARMVEEDRYCIDVLTQLQAVRSALALVESEMLKDHLGHCVEAAMTGGDPADQRQKASELIQLLERAI